jgi:hypothetical protein
VVSTASSVKKLKKDLKYQLAQLKETKSDIYESEGEDEASHFQMDAALQFSQVDTEL